jgi:hypothetical protein
MKKKSSKLSPNTNDGGRIVHIMFNVNEHERIINPILTQGPDTVYYFHYEGEIQDVHPEFLKKNLETIRQHLPSTEIIEIGVNYTDYYAIIGNFAEILSKEQKRHTKRVTINLGTGSKMVAVAVMDAERLWGKRHNIELIYQYTKDYNPKRTEGAHLGALLSANLPKFAFEKPNDLLIKSLQILNFLMKHDPHQRMRQFVPLRDWLEAVVDKYKLITVTENETERKELQSKYTRMKKKIVEPLESKWGLIFEERVGKKAYNIKFTDAGKNFIKVFEKYDLGLDLES